MTTSQPHFRKLALELWEWPAGSILELSAKVGAGAGQSNYAELQRLVSMKNLSLNAAKVPGRAWCWKHLHTTNPCLDDPGLNISPLTVRREC